jgi:transcriptional regulator with XRE-family HTH domain
MPRRDLIFPAIDPDDLVSYNLRQARELRGWTQEQAVARLDQFGLTWSVASLSDAERAWDPVKGRNREFTAADLITFSLAYELPVVFWFLPIPDPGPALSFGLTRYGEVEPGAYLEVLLGVSVEVEDRLRALGTPRELTNTDRHRLLSILTKHQGVMESVLREVREALQELSDPPGGDDREAQSK